jgi:Flp pilus assembly protein TadG
MVNKGMLQRRGKLLFHKETGQSMVEFAMILPLMVLIVLGIFEIGRAFFAYIAISNAAREGVRMYTFTPNTTTVNQITSTVVDEVGTTTLVDPDKITSITIACGNAYGLVTTDAQLKACPKEQPIRVSVTYAHDLILGIIFSQPLTIGRSVEMMKP